MSANLPWPKAAVGTGADTRHACKREGKKLLKLWSPGQSVPAPMEVLLPAGTRILYDGRVDPLSAERTARVFALEALVEGFDDLDDPRRDRTEDALHELFLRRPWGVLFRAIFRPRVGSFEKTVAELAALTRDWDVLATARYPFDRTADDSFDRLVESHLGSTFDVWYPKRAGHIRDRLEMALAAMRSSSHSDQEEAILRQVRQQLPRLAKQTSGMEPFEDEAFTRGRLRALDKTEWKRVASARSSDVAEFLVNQAYVMTRSQKGRHA